MKIQIELNDYPIPHNFYIDGIHFPNIRKIESADGVDPYLKYPNSNLQIGSRVICTFYVPENKIEIDDDVLRFL